MSLIRIPNSNTAVPQEYELQVSDLVNGLLPPTTDSSGSAVSVAGSLGKIVDGANINGKVEFTYSENLADWYIRDTVTKGSSNQSAINMIAGGVNNFSQNSLGLVVSDSLASVHTLDTSKLYRLFIEVAVGDNDLDQFEIHARANASGSYQSLYSASSNYLAPKGILKGVSGDLTAINTTFSGWLIMDVSTLESLQLHMASSNAAGSTIDVYAGGY